MENQQSDAHNPTQAPKKFTPKPRKPFTTAREYKKMFTQRVMKQAPKKQEIQELQEVEDQNFWVLFLLFEFSVFGV